MSVRGSKEGKQPGEKVGDAAVWMGEGRGKGPTKGHPEGLEGDEQRAGEDRDRELLWGCLLCHLLPFQYLI